MNSGDSRILAAGVAVNYPGQPPYMSGSGDSLDFIAAHFGVALPELLSNSDVLANAALVIPLAVLGTPNFSYPVSAGDTLSLIGGRFGVSQDALAGANLDVSSLFDSASDPNLNVPELSQFQVNALIDEAERTLALQNLAAMTSRFYLSGLRLPTQGLTPNYPGLFVSGGPGSYQIPRGAWPLRAHRPGLPAAQHRQRRSGLQLLAHARQFRNMAQPRRARRRFRYLQSQLGR